MPGIAFPVSMFNLHCEKNQQHYLDWKCVRSQVCLCCNGRETCRKYRMDKRLNASMKISMTNRARKKKQPPHDAIDRMNASQTMIKIRTYHLYIDKWRKRTHSHALPKCRKLRNKRKKRVCGMHWIAVDLDYVLRLWKMCDVIQCGITLGINTNYSRHSMCSLARFLSIYLTFSLSSSLVVVVANCPCLSMWIDFSSTHRILLSNETL